MEMKYIIFLSGLILCVPFGILIASTSRRIQELVFFVMLISTSYIERYDINIMSREWYHAPTRGFEISFVDLLAIILFFSVVTNAKRQKFSFYWPHSLGLMLAFLLYSCLNVAYSDPKLFGLFSILVLVRGIIVFLAVAFFVRSPRDIYLFIFAISGILIYQGGYAIYQRYFAMIYRVRGTFLHANILGNYCVLLAPVVLSVALSDAKNIVKRFCTVAWVLSCVGIVLTISRMSVLALSVSSTGVLLVSLGNQINPKKIALIIILGIVGAAMVYRGFGALEERHNAYAREGNELMADRQGQFNLMWYIILDYPMGIGLNNWSYIVSEHYADEYGPGPDGKQIQPYESPHERGQSGSRAIMGHTTIGLTLAELGWPGFFLFIAMWIYWASITGRYILKGAHDMQTNIMIGCFFGLVAAFFMVLIEHIFRSQYFYIIFNCFLGLAMAVYQMIKQENIRFYSKETY